MRNLETPFKTQTEYLRFADTPDVLNIVVENVVVGRIDLIELKKLSDLRFPNGDLFDTLKYILNEN